MGGKFDSHPSETIKKLNFAVPTSADALDWYVPQRLRRSFQKIPMESLLSRDDELILHRRLLDNDPTASRDLCAAFLEHLISSLLQRNRKVHEELCVTAAEDALLALMKNPHSYKSDLQSLIVYLRISAQGDLRNLLAQEGRHQTSRDTSESVEDLPDGGKYLRDDDEPAHRAEINEELEHVYQHILPLVREGLSDVELKALDLLLAGERKTAAFAEACGFADLSQIEQESRVKAIKDKLKKRIERRRT
jgi:hypothetical protein